MKDIDRRVTKYLQEHPPTFRDGHGAYIAYREESVVSSCPSVATIQVGYNNEDERGSIGPSGQCTRLCPSMLRLVLMSCNRGKQSDERNEARESNTVCTVE